MQECYRLAAEARANHDDVMARLLLDPFAAARHSLRLRKHDNGNSDKHEATQVCIQIF